MRVAGAWSCEASFSAPIGAARGLAASEKAFCPLPRSCFLAEHVPHVLKQMILEKNPPESADRQLLFVRTFLSEIASRAEDREVFNVRCVLGGFPAGYSCA